MRWLVLCAGLLLAACDDPATARRALEDAGFTDVHIGGWSMFWCDSKSDMFTTTFTAKNPQGRAVSGAVCNGWFKGATIRF